MDWQAVVCRTERGEEEIQHRRHGIERSLRYVLILVDGSSSVEQLIAKGAGLDSVEASLRLLAEQGFVSIAGAIPASGQQDFSRVKAELIGIAREVLGADAGNIVSKLESAPDSRDGLLEVTHSCKKLVKLVIDEAKAEQLFSRCRTVLGTL